MQRFTYISWKKEYSPDLKTSPEEAIVISSEKMKLNYVVFERVVFHKVVPRNFTKYKRIRISIFGKRNSQAPSVLCSYAEAVAQMYSLKRCS